MGGRCVSHDNQPACPIAPPTPTPTPPPALAPGVVYHWGNGWDCLAGFTAEMSYNATFGLNGAAAPKPGEQFAMTVCRKVGDTWSMLQGAGEIAGGGTLAGGGAVACGTVVLCFVGGGAAAVGGAAIAAHGAVTAVYGTWNLVASAVTTCLAASATGGGGGTPPPTPTPAPTPIRTPVTAPKHSLVNALRDFTRIDFNAGKETFSITKERMAHFLSRHHPAYWDGSTKLTQTFLDPSLSVDDVGMLVKQTVQTGYNTRAPSGFAGTFSYTTEINGVTYRATTVFGKVVQFYPLP